MTPITYPPAILALADGTIFYGQPFGVPVTITGEVMGHARRFGAAFAKAQMAVDDTLPRPEDGAVVISVNDFDKGTALTPFGSTSFSDGMLVRPEAARLGIPLVTTLTAAQAAVNGIKVLAAESLQVQSLQALHGLVN